LASLLEFLTVSSIVLVSIFFLFIYSENASLM
jgi:hypothetical protein